jgi:hypothetical protein
MLVERLSKFPLSKSIASAKNVNALARMIFKKRCFSEKRKTRQQIMKAEIHHTHSQNQSLDEPSFI